MKLYPLKFQSVYKEKIWGGNKIKQYFNRELPDDKIGESWEVAAHPNGISIVNNGSLKGKKLTDLIEKNRSKVLGNIDFKSKRKFPLLIKFLDASQKLSVQVHPDNDYAQRVEGEPGKTEMWYIIDCDPGSKLVYGLKPGISKRETKKAIKNGTLENLLNEITVKPGEVYFIPAGTIHAIEEGILLAEIQQNSDTTYRVYDWNRTDNKGNSRELHIKKALEVADLNQKPAKSINKVLTINTENYTRQFLAACSHFVTEKIDLAKSFSIKPEGEKFYILIALKGTGKIVHKNKSYNFSSGETIMIPAALDKITIKGNLTLLKTYIPENKNNFVNKLSKLNFKKEVINNLPGIKSW